jgi:carboxyl-terminal processing protease
MPLRNLVWLLVIPGLVGLGLVIGASAPAPDKDYQLVRQIVEVLAEVDANYVRELTDDERQKLVEDMISGGLRELDPHSVYLNAKQLHEVEGDSLGSYGGVGIQLGGFDPKTKFLVVGYPMPGSPAYDAGVIAGDLIAKVEDESTAGMSGEQARNKIIGEPGSKVTLTIRREGHVPPEFPVTLTRARVPQHTIMGVSRRGDDPNRWNWFIDEANRIALIRIHALSPNGSGFNEQTAKELRSALEEIEAAGARGLILDLRNNPGGLLSQAIEVADLFLTEGKIVTTKDRRGGERTSKAKSAETMFLPASDKPIAVIVNNASASASEIVAAALQDNGRAAIVGERTFGKGSVQSLFRLSPDQKTAVKLTTQTWWRPNGKNMDRQGAPKDNPNEWGVAPDPGLEVPMEKHDVERQRINPERLRYEYEIDKLKFTAGRPDVAGAGSNPPKLNFPVPKDKDGKPLWDDSKPFEDRPLNRALEHLRKKLG